MSNTNDDDISFRFIFRSNPTANNNIFSSLFATYLLEYILEQDEDVYDNMYNMSSIDDYLLQAGMRESEEMYKYLEKKDITLNIETKKFKDFITDYKECKECVICKDEFKNEDDVTKLNCTHIFHNDCIKEWGTYKAECPVCRKDIEIKDHDKM